MPKTATALTRLSVPLEVVERRIYVFRGLKVMLDTDLAALYAVPTFRLNEAVKRSRNRFPEDFMFQLTPQETEALTSHFAMSNAGRGGRRTLPFAFTELGVAMLSSVLKSERAVQMNIVIMRAFVRLRQTLASKPDFAAKISKIEARQKKQSSILSVVIDDIESLNKHVAREFKRLTAPPRKRKPSIGFYSGAK